MVRRELILLIVLSLAGGAAGRVLSHVFFGERSALAERTHQAEKAAWVDTVIAKNFQLVDDEDNIRGIFSLTSSGRLYLDLRDTESVLRAELFLDPGGKAGLSLFDAQGEERSRLSVEPTGTPMLAFYDAPGTARAAFGLKPGEIPSISFFDRKGNRRALVGLLTSDVPSIRIYDSNGKSRAILGGASLENLATGEITQRPVNSLVLVDEKGRVFVHVP